jgi:hypothetical protein
VTSISRRGVWAGRRSPSSTSSREGVSGTSRGVGIAPPSSHGDPTGIGVVGRAGGVGACCSSS